MTDNGNKPKTLLDLAKERKLGVHTPTQHDMTLEQALKQVDEKMGGDEALKQLYRELYAMNIEPSTEQES